MLLDNQRCKATEVEFDLARGMGAVTNPRSDALENFRSYRLSWHEYSLPYAVIQGRGFFQSSSPIHYPGSVPDKVVITNIQDAGPIAEIVRP
jgi:hypothetical protein